MTLPTRSNQPDDRSFLRTGAPDTSGADGETHNDQSPIRPSVPLDPEWIAPLAAQDRIGMWAVHLDPPATAGVSLHKALAECLSQVARTHGGQWFQWDSGLYGCLLPDADAAAAAALARRFLTTWSDRRVESLSIGVSQFPLLDFDRETCLYNACKALDHAAFFGPASVVIFDAVSLNISGDHCFQSGRPADAIAEYRHALRLDPSDVNVLNSLGGCLAQMEDRTGAREAFATALQINPREPMALYNLGVLDLLDGQPASAMDKFRQAHGLDAALFEPLLQLGKWFTEQHAHDEARQYLEKAVVLQPERAVVHSLLGQCLAARGHAREAIMACKKAVKLNPNDAAAFSQLGLLYDAKGENPDICITFCRQSVTLCPDNSLFHLRLAELYHKHHHLESALAAYQTAADLGADTGNRITEIQEQPATPDAKQRYA